MIRGLYTSGWSMLVDQKRLDVLSNNLANVNTNGYKKDTVVIESFPELLAKRINDNQSISNPTGNVGSMELGRDVGEIFTNYTQGQFLKTDDNFDLAIQASDSAFFTIGIPDENGDIKEYYSRDGSFKIDTNGNFVTKDGKLVMGVNGPIVLKSSEFNISTEGEVIQDGEIVDRLLIKDFKDTKTLRKYGNNLVEKTDQTEEQEFKGVIAQGFIEQSNVNVVREMIDIITVMRSYEANQKIMQQLDSTLEKTVNQVGALQ